MEIHCPACFEMLVASVADGVVITSARIKCPCGHVIKVKNNEEVEE